MNIVSEKLEGYTLLIASGKVDAVTCPDLDKALNEHLEAGEKNILLDMSGVPYISSAGLRVILLATKRLYGNGKVVLCSVQENVQDVLKLAGFTNVMQIFPDRESAKQAF